MHKLPAGDPQGADHVSKQIDLAFNFYHEQSIPSDHLIGNLPCVITSLSLNASIRWPKTNG